MGSEEEFQDGYTFTCANCGNTVAPGERMLTLCTSLEIPICNGVVECTEDSVVSHLCSYCASLLSGGLNVVVSEADDEVGNAVLSAHCSEQGIVLDLHCSDGISWAPSPLFAWKQIAQLLIVVDSNMFGDLKEPLHQVFLRNLKLLGYAVPN